VIVGLGKWCKRPQDVQECKRAMQKQGNPGNRWPNGKWVPSRQATTSRLLRFPALLGGGLSRSGTQTSGAASGERHVTLRGVARQLPLSGAGPVVRCS
jgi:hypothetical protein